MANDDVLIEEVKQVVVSNLQDHTFNVNKLCYFMRVSRSSIYRKVMCQCQCSPQELIEDIRLEVAKKKIENEKMCFIQEIAYEVGFNYPKNFTKRFKQKYSLTPNEFKKSLQCSVS